MPDYTGTAQRAFVLRVVTYIVCPSGVTARAEGLLTMSMVCTTVPNGLITDKLFNRTLRSRQYNDHTPVVFT